MLYDLPLGLPSGLDYISSELRIGHPSLLTHTRKVVEAEPYASIARLGPDWRISQSPGLVTIGYGH